jgi:hypothetical protein
MTKGRPVELRIRIRGKTQDEIKQALDELLSDLRVSILDKSHPLHGCVIQHEFK